MENRWLLTWLLAPILAPGATAVEAYSLRWYRLDADMQPLPTDQGDFLANAVTVEPVWLRAHIVIMTIALTLLAGCFVAAQDAPRHAGGSVRPSR